MISLILRDGLLVKYLKCRGSPARFTVKKGNVTYIFRWHLSRAIFSLFEVSLRICVIRSNGSECLDVQPVQKSGSHMIGGGPRQSHCVPQRQTVFCKADLQPARGPRPTFLRACRFSARASLVGSSLARLRTGSGASGASAFGFPLRFCRSWGREPAHRESLTRRVCSSALERGASVVCRACSDIDASTTTHVCTRIHKREKVCEYSRTRGERIFGARGFSSSVRTPADSR